MTWFVWRQHRGQALWALLTLGTMCTLMLWVGLRASDSLGPTGDCVIREASRPDSAIRVGCRQGTEQFAMSYNYAIPVFEMGVPLVLAIVGALAGAPLVAREIEQRTHLVAWTQSVSRRRWYVTKVLAIGAGLAGVGLLAGFANYRLQQPLTEGGLTASRWPWFFSAGLAPAGEILLAFALAVAGGAWLRRTLPAVGTALVSFLALLLVTGRAIQILTPTSRTTGPRFDVPLDGWVIQTRHGEGVPYHPAGQFWPLQLTFLAVLVTLAIALFALGRHATRTRAV